MRTILISLGLLFLGINTFSQQVAKSTTYNGSFVGFLEYKPTNYNDNKNKKYPLIIFLHGIGERGNGTNEINNLLQQAIPKNINEGAKMTFTVNGKTETFLVLSPQLPKWLGAWDNLYVDAMLEYAKKNLRIDEKRIFLTGISLGGGGVWNYASTSLKNAKQFAAIAPICGVCYYDMKAVEPTIGKAGIGVWAFANLDDNIVDAWCTVGAVEMLEKGANKKKVKKTINRWGGHDAWTKAYDMGHAVNSPNLFEWFLGESESDDDDDDDNNSNYPQPLPINAAPVAKAGNDITITLPVNTITLRNSGSFDGDGNIKGWNWSKVSGPAQFSIASANNESTVVNNLEAGTYVFRLTVTDNGNATATDDITIIVNRAPNAAPVAKAGNDITITLPTNSVTLNNSGSFDGDGNIKGWNWSKVSGPSQLSITSANSSSTSVTNLEAGTYVFRLTVTDNENATATDDLTVTVNRAPNAAPVAKAGNDITITLPTNSVTLNNSGSFDGDGNIKGWNWSKVSGPSQFSIASANNSSTSVNNLEAGTYVFRLTVTDDDNATATDDLSVTVLPAPVIASKPPVADAGKDEKIPVGQATVLYGEKSYSENGTIRTYRWSKVSGPSKFEILTPDAKNSWIRNMEQGVYVYRLTITDNNGNTDADDVSITVNGSLPIANAGKDETIPVGQATVLRGDDSYVIGGNIRNYSWSKISGPSAFEIMTPESKSTWIRNMTAGVYIYRLTVKDNNGSEAIDDVTITVKTQGAPVANAGKDETIPVGQATVLRGDNSYAPNGNIRNYKWSKISGPNSYEIMTSDTKSTWIRNMTSGTYVYRLTVTDFSGASASDDVVITVYSNVASRAGNEANEQALAPQELNPNVIAVTEKLNIYPNPVISSLNIRWSGEQRGPATINIVDAGGRIVKTIQVKKEQNDLNTSIELSKLVPGIYMIQIQSQNGKPLNTQFLKR